MKKTSRKFTRREFFTKVGAGLGSYALLSINKFSIAGLFSKSVEIGMVSDVHYANTEPAFGVNPRGAKDRLKAFITEMNKWNPNFIIELGDFINGRIEDLSEEDTKKDLIAIEKVYKSFSGRRYYVLGNHELYCLSKSQFQSFTGMDYYYKSFNLSDYHFIILDAQYDYSTGEDRDHDFLYLTGYVPQQEKDWLKEDLGSIEKPTVIFIHQRLDVLDPQNVRNAPEIRRIVNESGNVIAVFQGHDHKNIHNQIDNIHYITLEALADISRESAWSKVRLDPVGNRIIIDGCSGQASYELGY